MKEAVLLSPDSAVVGTFVVVSRKDAPSKPRHDTGEIVFVPGPLLEAELIGHVLVPQGTPFVILVDGIEYPVRVKLSQRLPGGSELTYIKVASAE